MDYRILGPLEVLDDTGAPLALGGAKQRAVLALLLLHADEVVSADRLMDDLWGEEPPDTAANTLQVYVSQLRKILRVSGAEPLVTQRPGYRLAVGPDELDLVRVERLRREATEALDADDAAGAALRFREALALWRGEPLADFAFEPFASAEIERLEELRSVTLEDRFEAELEAGRHGELVPDLEAILRTHPHRERLRAHLMLALYRAGRQAAALAVYQEGAERLADELGIDPGPELRRLQEAILRQEDWLVAPARVAPVVPTIAPIREERFAPTEGEAVLVSGVAVRIPSAPAGIPTEEWVSLVPELLGRIGRAGEATGATLLRSGPEALDLCFGLPLSRPDDLDRAARLALRAISETHTFEEEIARGWDAGAPEVLVGLRATRVAIGKEGRPSWIDPADPVGAGAVALASGAGRVLTDRSTAGRLPLGWGVQAVRDDLVMLVGPEESRRIRSATPFVGREHELSVTREVLADLLAGRGRILLIEGEVGIGKTRLLEELRGSARGLAWLDAAGLEGPDRADLVQTARRLATDGPLVVVGEDIHAMPSDLTSALGELLGDTDTAPLLIAMTLDPATGATARELWGAVLTDYRHRAAHVVLGPLSEDEAGALAEALSPTGAFDPATRSELVARAEGNPLYLEELIRTLSGSGALERGGGWTMSMTTSWMVLPPSLEGLLAGRIQRIPEGARHVAQVAAVIGREFSVELVEQVESRDVREDLWVLLHAEVVREVRRFPDLACTFRHRLLQDAALATLTPARARELYGRVGAAYEDWVRDPGAEDIERLAFYFYRSDDDERALRYLERAVARARGAHRAELSARAKKIADRTGAAPG